MLTGYTDPPAGVKLQDGQYYNPYFMGGAIGMAKALYDEVIEYGDGTPATTPQLAKDVATFLSWASQREHDDRKQLAIKVVILIKVFIQGHIKKILFFFLGFVLGCTHVFNVSVVEEALLQLFKNKKDCIYAITKATQVNSTSIGNVNCYT